MDARPPHRPHPRTKSPCRSFATPISTPRKGACTVRSMLLRPQNSAPGVFLKLHMRRLMAQFVLLSVLLSLFAPALEAFSMPASHACCMRKMHGHRSHDAAFQAASCCQHDCCGTLTAPHCAALLPSFATNFYFVQGHDFHGAVFSFEAIPPSDHSGRAPPVFSLS